MPAPATADAIRDVNVRYHDEAAASYDSKWGIDFGEVGRRQVTMKLRKALGGDLPRFRRSLEIGAGTGYFTLHLMLAGVLESAVCTDISPGMLTALSANADRLGLEVETVRTEAERLPFADASFDLVLGHAVLHHLPDLPASFAEFARVLEPRGALVFAGEPSRVGDRLAAVPKRAATLAAPIWRRAMGAGMRPKERMYAHPHAHELERQVDVHAFAPDELAALARGAGLDQVRVRGEELTANWFGWTNRVLEATAEPDEIPWLWRQYAYRGYLALQALDRRVLEPRLPAAVFYNLLLAASKPPRAAR